MMQLPLGRQEQNDGNRKVHTHRLLQIRLAVAAVIISLVALLVVPTLAWLNYHRSIQTVTMVNRPNAMIGAGNVKPIMELELSDIDVTGEQQYKDIVFCVYSASSISYRLQLAHTTNIGFAYSIYPAQMGTGGPDQVSYLGDNYSFDVSNAVTGQYLNPGTDNLAIGSGNFHDKTYASQDGSGISYDHVQAHAEPLYWQNTEKLTLPTQKDTSGYYVDFYVLRVAWNGTVQNNKETDLVYLMAESASYN